MPHTRISTSYDLGPEGAILIATTDGDPAAGAEVSITVPGRAVWDVIAIGFVLDTDGTVASRQPALIIDDGQDRIIRLPSEGSTTANSIKSYAWYRGAGHHTNTNNGLTGSLPEPTILLPGWRVLTDTNNLQAGDNFTAPMVYVREVPQRGIAAGQDALLSALRRLIGEEALSG